MAASGLSRWRRRKTSARHLAGRSSFLGVALVQYWFSPDGEKAVLPRFEYRRIAVKSLFYGDTTIRKGRPEVPMDHLPRLQVEYGLRKEW